ADSPPSRVGTPNENQPEQTGPLRGTAFSFFLRASENVFERKLHNARPSRRRDYCPRITTCRGGNGRTAQNPSEVTAREVRRGITKVDAVRNVEGLGPELDLLAFGDLEFSGYGLIPFPESRTSQGADTHIPVRAWRGQSECGTVDPTHAWSRQTALTLVGGSHVSQQLIRPLWYRNGAQTCADSVVSLIAPDLGAQGLAGIGLEDAGESPGG